MQTVIWCVLTVNKYACQSLGMIQLVKHNIVGRTCSEGKLKFECYSVRTHESERESVWQLTYLSAGIPCMQFCGVQETSR